MRKAEEAYTFFFRITWRLGRTTHVLWYRRIKKEDAPAPVVVLKRGALPV